jgi:hypothetical protein
VHVNGPNRTAATWRDMIAIACATAAALTLTVSTVIPAQARQAAAAKHSPFAPKRADPDKDGDFEEHDSCTPVRGIGKEACLAIVRDDIKEPNEGGHAGPLSPAGYGPSSLRTAYALTSDKGSGRTVAIVDSYNDPKAESDLATYRGAFGLPACTTSNGCFKKVDQNGGSHYPKADSGWAGEISLDLDMVSAICPDCHILLVEASSNSMTDLGKSVNRAVSLGARFVSNSYGGDESSSDPSYDSAYFNHPGVAITVSSGDNGYGTSYPAASRYVTSVGGTTLRPSSKSRGWTETVWSGTGSGCSSYDAKPASETDKGCSRRTMADVSAVADPNTGVAVYDTYGANGWAVYGGTSVSSPIIAAVYALAGNPAPGTYPASYPYAHLSELNDITSGSNGSCGGSYLCTAKVGFDGPTGLGTPKGYSAFAS